MLEEKRKQEDPEMSKKEPGWTKEEEVTDYYRTSLFTFFIIFSGVIIYTVFYFYSEWWKESWGYSLFLVIFWLGFLVWYYYVFRYHKKQLKDYLKSKNKKFSFFKPFFS